MILAPIQTLLGVNSPTFKSGEVRPTLERGGIGVQLATTISRGLLNRSGFVLLILLLCMVGQNWGACISSGANGSSNSRYYCPYGQDGGCTTAQQNCQGTPDCEIECAPTYALYGKVYTAVTLTGSRCIYNAYGGQPACGKYYGYLSVSTCRYTIQCDSQCEADSVACVQKGSPWVWQGCEQGCVQQICTDTSFVISSCAYSPQRGQYINMLDHHIIKDCKDSSWQTQYYAATCDTAGHDTTLKCLGTFDGVHVVVQAANGATSTCAADGSCDMAIRKILAGECKDPRPNPQQSSSSNGESSSSEASSSSDSGESSSSGEGDTSGVARHVIVDELPQRIYDSLGHIDYNIEIMQPFVSGIYDGVYEMLGNQYDMKENQRQGLELLGDIRDAAESADSKLSTTNSLLNDIKNKNWSPNINVQPAAVNIDMSGVQNRQDETRDTIHNTNSLLESISSKLDGLGHDTLHVDTSKAPASIDSALKYWGNSNNRTFGAAGLDSSGWGAAVEAVTGFADSVSNHIAGLDPIYGCDTTGGRKCDGNLIGSGGISSASGQYRDTYHALGDSLTGGAFGDSLSNWASKFNNSRLSGGGSDNCPSVFTRTWTIPFARLGSVQVGPIGTYVCAPIFGNVTGFALGRVLLRAIVAISCMWFLFKCATGFRGGSDGEDD